MSPSSTTTASTTSSRTTSRRENGEYSQIGQEHEHEQEQEQQGAETHSRIPAGAPSSAASAASSASATPSSQASNLLAVVRTELQTLVSTLYTSSDGGTRAVLTLGILAVAVVLVGIWTVRVILRHWAVIGVLSVGSMVILGVALNVRNVYYNTLPQHDHHFLHDNDNENESDLVDSRMQRINREREESEAMASQAAQMMLDIDRHHLQEFLQHHPQATYEEWIADLHPDNVVVNNNTDNNPKIEIDHRFYVQDSDHLAMWKEQQTAAVSQKGGTSF